MPSKWGDKLTIDLATYEDASIIEHFYMNRLTLTDEQIPPGRMERFVFNLEEKKVEERRLLADACIELPHFDYKHYYGRSDYRYVYGCGIAPSRRNEFYNQLVKIDIHTGEHMVWQQAGDYPGEPVFVPHPNRKTEDDGVLLSVVLNGRQGHSFLLVLDAQSMEERARACLPHPILFGFHGIFLDKE